MKSLLTRLDRALVAVKTGQQHKDLPLASVREAVTLLAHVNSAETIDVQRGGTYQDPDFQSLHPGVLSTYFRRCAENRTEKRRVEGTRLQREASARDVHDTIVRPRDPATVRGTPRDTRWTVDDEISDGKITNIYSGSASDYRLALRDLKSGKASDARQGLLALSSDLPRARVAATQETSIQRRQDVDARYLDLLLDAESKATTEALEDQARACSKARHLHHKRLAKKAKRQRSRSRR